MNLELFLACTLNKQAAEALYRRQSHCLVRFEHQWNNQVSLLSFDDEEGPSPIKIKASIKERSKAKLKPNLQSLRLGEDSKPASSQRSQAGATSWRLHMFWGRAGRGLFILQIPTPCLIEPAFGFVGTSIWIHAFHFAVSVFLRVYKDLRGTSRKRKGARLSIPNAQ